MYLDLLTKIKNGQAVKKESVKLPYSEMDFLIAELLTKHKFADGASKKGRAPKRVLEVKLRYDKEGKGAVQGINVLSRPSRRLYTGYKDLRPVRQGYGLLIISTPKGIMDGKSARQQKLGGQLLFQIW